MLLLDLLQLLLTKSLLLLHHRHLVQAAVQGDRHSARQLELTFDIWDNRPADRAAKAAQRHQGQGQGRGQLGCV